MHMRYQFEELSNEHKIEIVPNQWKIWQIQAIEKLFVQKKKKKNTTK